MKLNDTLTRRTLLAAVGGGAGVFGAIGIRRALSKPVDHDAAMLVQADGINLQVAWKQWYNDEVVSASETTENGPLITIPNVLPGDSGRIHFELSLAAAEDVDEAELAMRLQTPENAFQERGIVEPERAAGDTTTATAELQHHLTVTAWYDEGTVAAAACNGTRNSMPKERAIAGVDERPLVSAVEPRHLGDWVTLDAAPNAGGTQCLPTDEALCIGIRWAVPEDVPGVDDNVFQSDAATVAIEFAASACSSQTGAGQG